MQSLQGKCPGLIKWIDQHMGLESTRASGILNQDTQYQLVPLSHYHGDIQALHHRFACLHAKPQQLEVTDGQTQSSSAGFYPVLGPDTSILISTSCPSFPKPFCPWAISAQPQASLRWGDKPCLQDTTRSHGPNLHRHSCLRQKLGWVWLREKWTMLVLMLPTLIHATQAITQ